MPVNISGFYLKHGLLTNVTVDRIYIIFVCIAARNIIDEHTSACPWSIHPRIQQNLKAIIDQESRSDRPRYRVNKRWTPPLPLASVGVLARSW